MCGIAGIVDKTGNRPDRYTLEKMLNTIAQRGPDDEGHFFYENVALGHRRLAVIDLSDAGHQPMHYKEYSIVFNGEIYNYLEIRRELIKRGHKFMSESDTEVILHAYEEWRESCLGYFNGMWAFAILDSKKDLLFCARDRFGIKPFYYFENERIFAFASEIKALLSSNIPARVNLEVLLTYLVVGFTDHSNKTFFRDIFQLLPGCHVIINLNDGTKKLERYYDLSTAVLPLIKKNEIAKILEEIICLHLRSDVPVGTCLSGGLDSSTIAAIASRIIINKTHEKFGAITAQSEAAENDESGFARQVHEHCHLKWHLVKPTYNDFAKNIEEVLRVQDEPVGGASVFMQYWVMKSAKEAGYKVLLDGQGGDETLLGYERYYAAFFWHLLATGQWPRLLREYYLAFNHSKLKFLQLTSYAFYFLISPLREHYLARKVRFLKRKYIEIALDMLRHFRGSFFNLRKLQCLELTTYQLPHLLRYEDRNSMAHSIEARVPLVDHRYVEAALALAPTEKIKNGYTKYALRQVADSLLPKAIVWRRDKIGFEAPDEKWLKQHLPTMQEKVASSELLKALCLESPDFPRLSLTIQWRLYNISVWENQYHAKL